jgi:hypothetical protein
VGRRRRELDSAAAPRAAGAFRLSSRGKAARAVCCRWAAADYQLVRDRERHSHARSTVSAPSGNFATLEPLSRKAVEGRVEMSTARGASITPFLISQFSWRLLNGRSSGGLSCLNGCSTRTSRAGRAAAEPCHADPCRVDPTRELFTHDRGGDPLSLRVSSFDGAARRGPARSMPLPVGVSFSEARSVVRGQCFVWSILMRCRTRRRAVRPSVRPVGWAVCRLASASWQRLPAPRSGYYSAGVWDDEVAAPTKRNTRASIEALN